MVGAFIVLSLQRYYVLIQPHPTRRNHAVKLRSMKSQFNGKALHDDLATTITTANGGLSYTVKKRLIEDVMGEKKRKIDQIYRKFNITVIKTPFMKMVDQKNDRKKENGHKKAAVGDVPTKEDGTKNE